jgi:hypothetical protein
MEDTVIGPFAFLEATATCWVNNDAGGLEPQVAYYALKFFDKNMPDKWIGQESVLTCNRSPELTSLAVFLWQ